MMPQSSFLKFVITVSLIFSIFYIPSNQTPRAHALFGVGDINLESVPIVVRFLLETIAFPIAQTMIDDMTRATIEWANTGFYGSPAYNINPGEYFEELADNAAGAVIQNELPFLCSPFRDSVRFTLSLNYYDPPERYFQCTFSEVENNIRDFKQGFSKGGGWDTWFEVTQNPTNNPRGAYIAARARIDSKIQEESTRSRDELNQNSGYFNYRECLEVNPDESVLDSIREGLKHSDPVRRSAAKNYPTDKYDLNKQPGECIKRGDITSPGTSIKSALETSFAAPVAKLIQADSVDQLLSAFSTGLLRRYVFAKDNQGLFSSRSVGAERELLDVDGDGIPDGYDTNSPTEDGYGELNICSHGIIDSTQDPSNSNCKLSKNINSSPFYLPICEKLGNTIGELDRHYKFVNENGFNKNLSNIWLNKTLPAASAVGDFLGILTRLEITNDGFVSAMEVLGRYSKDLDKISKSLAKDGDLKEGWRARKVLGIGLGGGDDDDARKKHARNTAKVIAYLEEFQSTVSQNCSAPDLDTAASLVTPELEDVPDPDIETTETSTTTQETL